MAGSHTYLPETAEEMNCAGSGVPLLPVPAVPLENKILK